MKGPTHASVGSFAFHLFERALELKALMLRVRDYVILARPFTLLVPALGSFTGAMCAFRSSSSSDGLAVAAFQALFGIAVPAALLNASSNAINQIYDLPIDRQAKAERPLPSGRISVRGCWIFTALTLLIASVCVGAVLMFGREVHADAPLHTSLIFAAAGLLAWAYSAPPLRLRRLLGISNLVIAIPRGFLLPLAGWSLYGPITDPRALVLGAVPGLFLLGAASTKDFADAEADASQGVRTLANVYEPKRAIAMIRPFLSLPFFGLSLFIAVQFGGEGLSASAWTLLIAGLVLGVWGEITARGLRINPEALTSTENHPAWRHMYLMMLVYYLVHLIAGVPSIAQ